MKASEAYKQGLFDFCQFSNDEITVIAKNLRGTFRAQIDMNQTMVSIIEDSEMTEERGPAIKGIPLVTVSKTPATMPPAAAPVKQNILQRLFQGGKQNGK